MLRLHVRCVELETEASFKKIVLDAKMGNLMGSGRDKDFHDCKLHTSRNQSHRLRESHYQEFDSIIVDTSWHTCTSLVEFVYTICEARNPIIQAGFPKTPEELLTGMKPTVAHMLSFSCKVWALVANRPAKRIER